MQCRDSVDTVPVRCTRCGYLFETIDQAENKRQGARFSLWRESGGVTADRCQCGSIRTPQRIYIYLFKQEAFGKNHERLLASIVFCLSAKRRCHSPRRPSCLQRYGVAVSGPRDSLVSWDVKGRKRSEKDMQYVGPVFLFYFLSTWPPS